MDSVYKVIELIGTSPESWEHATRNALKVASESLREIRVAEVMKQDVRFDEKNNPFFRTKLKISFKYQGNQA